jgi:hypothetical protein
MSSPRDRPGLRQEVWARPVIGDGRLSIRDRRILLCYNVAVE